MSIYDISKQKLNSCYDVNGESLNFAYDIDKNIIFPDGEISNIRIMTYNVGSFYTEYIPTPNALSDVFFNRNKIIFTNANAKTASMQEYYRYIGVYESKTLLSELYSYSYTDYTPYPSLDAGIAISSKDKCYNMELIEYLHQGRQTRYYQKAYCYLNNKRVCLLNTHLDLISAARRQQFIELLDSVEDEEYFIITGDFNFDIHEVGDDEYNNSIQIAIDRGYNSAQNSNRLLKTYYNGNTIESSTAIGSPDNIITSSNIRITNTEVETTKLTDGLCVEYNIHIDHLPLIATIEIV